MQCKSCLQDLHYCGSCDYDFFLSNGYCSLECFKRSKEYANNIGIIRELWSSLDSNQQKFVEKLLHMESYYHDLDFDNIVVPKKEVIIMVGNIGSGKSHQTKLLKKTHNSIVISRDAMRFGIGAGDYIFNELYERIIKSSALEMFKKFLNLGVNLIVDEVNVAKTSREPYITLAKEAGYKVKAFILPRLSKEISLARKSNCSYGQAIEVWDSVWEKFNQRYEEPTLAEGFDELIHHKDYKHEDN